MDTKTKTTLDNLSLDTRHLVIYNDLTLTESDLDTIRYRVLSVAKRLESLTISGCGLTDHKMKTLFPSLTDHPCITTYDFSNNDFDNPNFATQIVTKAKKVHTLIFSQEREINHPNSQNFFDAVRNYNTLAILKMPLSIPNEDSINHFKKKATNLIRFHHLYPTFYPDIATISKDMMVDNKAKALELIEMIKDGKILTMDDVKLLNERLPSIIAVSEETQSRPAIMRQLKTLNEHLLTTMGAAIGIEIYTSETDFLPEHVPAPTPVVIEKELPTISAVLEKLTTKSEAILHAQITQGETAPHLLLNLGKETASDVGTIALASLQAMTHVNKLENPASSMSDFMDTFGRAKEIISQQIAHYEKGQDAPIQPPKRKIEGGNFFTRFFTKAPEQDPTQELNSLVEAGDLAKKAGQILQNMIPSLMNMEEVLSEKLVSSYNIVKAYQHTSEQLCLIQKVGTEVKESWENNASSTQRGPHVDILDNRLEFLQELDDQVQGHIASHLCQVAIKQKQQQGCATLHGKTIPLIAEQVATFMGQVDDLQTAGNFNALAHATQQTSETEKGTTFFTALKTLEAIENLVGSTQLAIQNMKTAATEISDNLAPHIAKNPQTSLPDPPSKDQITPPPIHGLNTLK